MIHYLIRLHRPMNCRRILILLSAAIEMKACRGRTFDPKLRQSTFPAHGMQTVEASGQ
jgi:hypothetical protein